VTQAAARVTGRYVRNGALRLPALLACAMAFFAFAPPAVAQTREAVAIVVHPESEVTDLTSAELRSIFLADRQFWNDRSRITLLVRAPSAYERDVVLHRVYRMDEAQFRQYWIGKMFRAEVATGPKIVASSDMAAQLVSAIRGAITFVPASEIRPNMRVVRIDGKLPSDPAYPIR